MAAIRAKWTNKISQAILLGCVLIFAAWLLNGPSILLPPWHGPVLDAIPAPASDRSVNGQFTLNSKFPAGMPLPKAESLLIGDGFNCRTIRLQKKELPGVEIWCERITGFHPFCTAAWRVMIAADNKGNIIGHSVSPIADCV